LGLVQKPMMKNGADEEDDDEEADAEATDEEADDAHACPGSYLQVLMFIGC